MNLPQIIVKNPKLKHTQYLVEKPPVPLGNYCGGITGKEKMLPNITIEQLLEAGVHLGHKTLRWNPKMKKYIFGRRDTIHIIDLTQTVELIKKALEKIHETISNRGNILFVSTKKQAADNIANLAKDTSQFYVNHRC